jgi:hypothetical protein
MTPVKRKMGCGGFAEISISITALGPIQVNARIPSCGTSGVGRWCNEGTLNPPFTIAASDP